MWRSLIAALALVALASPAAHAMPGDLPFAPTAPADGATLPTDPNGVPVAFTCPVYRISDAGGGFVVYGGARDYGVTFSRGPALGPDGRLTDPVALGTGSLVAGTQDSCDSGMNAGGSVRPQETPGLYYWQVWRLCTGCALGYETGPVRRLTLGSPARPTLKLPSRVYAGYPVIATVDGDSLPNGTAVTVERKRGSGWTRIGSDSLASDRAEVTVSLPKGKQTVRVTAVSGSETIASPELSRTVKAANAKPTKATAGRYRGTVGDGTESAQFTVSGRTLRAFRAYVPMLCPSVVAGQFTTQIGTASIAKIRIAPDGGFVGVATPAQNTSIRVRGRLAGAKLTGGRVELSVGNCTGNISFQVRKR